MVDFSDRGDVERWLDAIEPAKRRCEVAVGVAARAALRVTLLLARELTRGSSRATILSDLVLPSFRATGTVWAAAKYPGRRTELRAAAAAAARANTDYAAYAAANADYAAAYAADYAASATANAAYKVVSNAAHAVAYALAYADASADAAADAELIEAGRSGAELAGMPLWPNGMPDWATDARRTLRSALLAAGDDWEVWTDWYEARLAGDAGHPPNQALEIARATIPEGIWKQGPAVANGEIKLLMKEHAPETLRFTTAAAATAAPTSLPHIPALRPAALEPAFKDGRLTLPKTAAEATLPAQTIASALKALTQSLAELARAATEESNIDQRIVKRLSDIAERIPRKRPNQTELFRLGHEFDELKGYSKLVAESWPELIAARYAAMTLAFERTLRRFPKWVDFTREAPIGRVSTAEAHDISKVAETLSNVLRAAESQIVVESVLPDAIANLSAQLVDVAKRDESQPDPIEFVDELLAQDVLESLNNTLKRIAEGALAAMEGLDKAATFAGKKAGSYTKEFGEGADESLRKSFRKAGEAVGRAVIKLLKRSLYAGVGVKGAALAAPTLAVWLTAHYPQMYAWLEPVIAFLK
jgi:hypothetical protein